MRYPFQKKDSVSTIYFSDYFERISVLTLYLFRMALTAKQAAEKLGISLRQMQTLLKNERLPAQRFGNSWMIEEKDLELVRVRKPTGRPKKIKDGE